MALADETNLAALGVQADAFEGIPSEVVAESLEAASAIAISYFRARIGDSSTITSVGLAEKSAICRICAYDLMVVRGYNPGIGADQKLALRSEQAYAWLRGVARGEITPDIVYTTIEADRARARVLSSPPRGWVPWGRSRIFRG